MLVVGAVEAQEEGAADEDEDEEEVSMGVGSEPARVCADGHALLAAAPLAG